MAKRKNKQGTRAKISACYVVKDGAENFRRSLESVAAHVDEIVVVDSGATDETLDVAKSFGAKIFRKPWQDDFSAPRNVALRMATGDWIVFLDADEYFLNDSAKNLQAAIKFAQEAKAQGLTVKRDSGDCVPRIFQWTASVRYVGKIYAEVFSGDKPLSFVQVPAELLMLNHPATLSRDEAERNLKLLLEELATSDKPERVYAHLAEIYRALEDWANVEKFARLDVDAQVNPSSRPVKLLIECLEKNPSRAEELFEVSKLAVKRYPRVPEFSAKLANCLARKENFREAVDEMKRAIKKFKNCGEQFEPTNFDANAAQLLIDEWQKKIVLSPEEKRREASRLDDEMANYMERLNEPKKALVVADKVFELKPDDPAPLERAASVYIDSRIKEKADMALDYLEKNFPPSKYRLMLRAHHNMLLKNHAETIKFAKMALDFVDDDPRFLLTTMILLNVLGQSYRAVGAIKEAVECYERNVKLDLSTEKKSPYFAQMRDIQCSEYSNYLFNMHNLNYTREKIFEETQGFNKILAHVSRVKHSRKKHSRHKKIRVGYISPDIRLHVVEFFVIHLLIGYDRTRFKVYLYINNEEDHTTARIKERVDASRNIVGKHYSEVAAQIVEDEIDILFDLAGHTANNSLPVLSIKPAPIQISGIGYFDSTGLDTIDYFLADKYTDPEGLNEKFFTEKILRLQHSHFCYEWHAPLYTITPAPCTKNGYVTFCSFNNFAKVTDEMLALWKKILDAVPNSRLYLKGSVFDCDLGIELAKERIQAAGIDLDRVDMEKFSDDYIICYQRADIALDTFPYPGGGTTCDALFMGVPVITLVGERHNSRFGYSLLTNIGLDELCAFSEDEYVQKAVELANDWERIREYHLTIRRKMQESPVMNDTIYMGEVESAYEKIFNAWLAGKPLPNFPQEPEPVTEELADKYFARALEYAALEAEPGKSKFESLFDFKRTLYYAELAAQCESKIDAKLLIMIVITRHHLGDEPGAYEAARAAIDYIYSPAGQAKNHLSKFIAGCHKKMAEYSLFTRRHSEAVENYMRAFELSDEMPLRLELYDSILWELHFLDIGNEDMAAFHFEYQRIFDGLETFTTYHKPHARIKIGYICGDFCRHAAFSITFGFISCHDRKKFEVTCYSKNKKDDDYTELYRQNVEHFVDVRGLSAEELAKKIHDDEIDIAFDLAGHTAYNGLPALAYRPAPIQISGLGYMSTTGLKAIDYFLTDELIDPPGEHEKFFSEKFFYMPAQSSYARREDVLTPTGAPCVKNGYVTFGTICRYMKMTDDMLMIWTEILNRVPDSKLVMRAKEFASPQSVDELYSVMKSFGCDMERVSFLPAINDYLNAISEIDIMLDAYPYVGGVTTLDALYMGVPVVTLCGERRSTRFGKSILASVGLNELAVNSIEDYINTAVALAYDREFLDTLHKNLRQMFLNSSALDPERYCRLLEKKFMELVNG